ncbi:hypothetical protein OPV22_018507 [Ensete ventricosum]|uniref:Bidirectional sugar transporter SWEET n=1 Tax=Ensete ventricosum TaxID=4639 RepID=A0AAV8R0H5_ENSVE|nr:hypothetical protein OPV22_018507 [Ensete ventricosum]
MMRISADTIRTVFGIIGNGTALVLFFSPVPTFRRIWKSGSVEQFHATPYLATLLNCMFWILYGLPMRLRVLLVLVIEILFVGAVAAIVLTIVHGYMRRSLIVGVLCVIFGTLMYASPLSVMKQVIQSKSVEFMPLFLSLASFFNGICWTIYALIRFDLFITIPNGLGVAFAVAQLILYMMYRGSTARQMKERKQKMEMGLVNTNGSLKDDLENGTKIGN